MVKDERGNNPSFRAALPGSWFGSGEEREYFIENLAVLLASGMDMVSALEVIAQELRSRRMRSVLDQLKKEIEDGSPLWRALQKGRVLPERTLSLIRIGEETGRLSKNLSMIAMQRQKERIFRSKVRSAMLYPILVLSLTAVIGIGIAWFILPRLASVFSQLEITLPLVTKMLISAGEVMGKYGHVLIPMFLLFIAALIYFLFVFTRTRFLGERVLLRFPGIKKLIQEIELARLGYVWGTLLEAGIPIVEALGSVRETTVLFAYQRFYGAIRDSVEEGNSLYKSFTYFPKANRLIPVPVQQMIIAAERSGNLSKTLLKIGEAYEEKTEITTKTIAVLLEPILLVVVWLGVVTIALAVILPIYSLIGGLR